MTEKNFAQGLIIFLGATLGDFLNWTDILNQGMFLKPVSWWSVLSYRIKVVMDNLSTGLLTATRAGVKTGLVVYLNVLQQQNRLV